MNFLPDIVARAVHEIFLRINFADIRAARSACGQPSRGGKHDIFLNGNIASRALQYDGEIRHILGVFLSPRNPCPGNARSTRCSARVFLRLRRQSSSKITASRVKNPAPEARNADLPSAGQQQRFGGESQTTPLSWRKSAQNPLLQVKLGERLSGRDAPRPASLKKPLACYGIHDASGGAMRFQLLGSPADRPRTAGRGPPN